MQLDIFILITIAVFTILGFKNGFVYTIFFVLGWLIAIVIAFFTRHKVQDFLMDSTPVYDWYHDHVYDICLNFVTQYTDKLSGDLPGIFGQAVTSMGGKIAQEAADQITSASFGVFSFIGTVLVIKLILSIITFALSRRYRGGFVGAADAIFGALLGIAQGFIIVFIILILILPVSLAINPDLFEAVARMLDVSFLAETLFLNNPLIALIDGFAPELFDPGEWLKKADIELPENMPDIPGLEESLD
jgi:uncharacterized membrane protein required for colicin V production